MSEKNTPAEKVQETEAGEAAVEEAVDAADQRAEEGEQNKDSDSQSTANSLEELPEWAQKQITDLRRESASYRTERNTFREQLEAAQSEEDPEEQKKKFAELQENLEKERLRADRAEIAREAKLPPEADVLLHGKDTEELKRQATVLAQLFGTNAGVTTNSTGASSPAAPSPLPPRAPRQNDEAGPRDVKDLLAAARAQR